MNLFFSQTADSKEKDLAAVQIDANKANESIIYITKGITAYIGDDGSAAEVVEIKPAKKTKVQLPKKPKKLVKKSIKEKKIAKITNENQVIICSLNSSDLSYSNSTFLCCGKALQRTTGKQTTIKADTTTLINSLWVDRKLLAFSYISNKNLNAFSFFYKVRPPPFS